MNNRYGEKKEDLGKGSGDRVLRNIVERIGIESGWIAHILVLVAAPFLFVSPKA